jgi:shikimate kinase
LRKSRKWPLLADLERARALYDKRLPGYCRAAYLEIYVGDKATEEVAEELTLLLKLDRERIGAGL